MEHPEPCFTVLSRFVTPQEYASLCGVRAATVYDRFRRGRVAGIRVSGKLFIDMETSPPVADVGKRPAKAPPARMPDGVPPASELVCLVTWANHNRVHVDDILCAILYGKVRAWGIGGQVVVRKNEGILRAKLRG